MTDLSIETQLYIVTGVYGGILIFLVIFVIFLSLQFVKFKNRIASTGVTFASPRDHQFTPVSNAPHLIELEELNRRYRMSPSRPGSQPVRLNSMHEHELYDYNGRNRYFAGKGTEESRNHFADILTNNRIMFGTDFPATTPYNVNGFRRPVYRYPDAVLPAIPADEPQAPIHMNGRAYNNKRIFHDSDKYF